MDSASCAIRSCRGERMETFAAITLAGIIIFSYGLACFINYWRTRDRYWWRISVFAMSLGITMVWFWWW